MIRDIYETSPLFEKAKKGDISILDDPNCSLIEDGDGWTPLHYLANIGKIEILVHPDTFLAKNNHNKTPLHILSLSGALNEIILKKLFPWYTRKIEGVIFLSEIDEILNTPKSVQYILLED